MPPENPRNGIWFAGLAVTGIVMSNQLVATAYHVQMMWIGSFNVLAAIVFGGMFVVISLLLHSGVFCGGGTCLS